MYNRILQETIKEKGVKKLIDEQLQELRIREPAFQPAIESVITDENNTLLPLLIDWLSAHWQTANQGTSFSNTLISKKKTFERQFNKILNSAELALIEKLFFTFVWLQVFDRLQKEAVEAGDTQLQKIFTGMVNNTYQSQQEFWRRFKMSRDIE